VPFNEPFGCHGNEHSAHGQPELNQQFLATIPVGRWGDPKNIGQPALYLCSEDASSITGTDSVIDGGWTAQ
jgi:NAD(P)-dependent dehydrogenase (short-subunit alcohol dehydrogenase family)